MFQTSSRNSGTLLKQNGIMAGRHELFFLENVSVKFGKIQALKNIHLKIESGEVVFITGASGAGKTTLLRVLAGIQNVDKGRVSLPGKTIFTSQIFQDLRLIRNETCEENLFHAWDRSIYRDKNEFYQEMMDFCKILGIDNRLHLKVKDANGGLKQKVAFIRAMLSRPDVVIADEPTASLDYDNAKKMFDILNIYNVKRGMTVIWASHNKDLIKKFTGRILHLDKGKLVYSGHACFI